MNEVQGSHFIHLEPEGLAFLVQFCVPSTVAEAARRARVERTPALEALAARYVELGVLSAELTPEATVERYAFDPDAPDFLTYEEAFSSPVVDELMRAIEACELVAGNPLNPTLFGRTEGFAIRFRREALSLVRASFPWLEPFLARVLDPADRRALLGDAASEEANCFRVNVLLARGGVGLHLDEHPQLVSVLYLAVEGAGDLDGQLQLFRGKRPVGVLRPRRGMVATFRGDVAHGVTPTQREGARRISLVCEQYLRAPQALERFPHFTVDLGARRE